MVRIYMYPGMIFNCRLVSSVGRTPDCCMGGRGFKPQTGPTLRVYLCATLVNTAANGWTFKSSQIRTINHRPCLLHLQCYVVSRGHERTHKLITKSRARSSRCCGLALFPRLVPYIGLTTSRFSPLDRIVWEKLLCNSEWIVPLILRVFYTKDMQSKM